MKIFKAAAKSIINVFGMLDNVTEGLNELAIMFKQIAVSARQEQALESIVDIKAQAKAAGLTVKEVEALQASI